MLKSVRWGVVAVLWVLTVCGFTGQSAWAQTPLELTKADVTKQKTMDASQWAALGIRLGDTKDNAMRTLAGIKTISVQEDAAVGRIFVLSPANSKTVVMSLKVVENQVTTLNLVGGFGEWLQGDTKLLFRAFEDDSLRHKLLGREDGRQTVQGGTKESPVVNVTYAYYKEGLLLSLAAKRSADGKQTETTRELVLIYPARSR